MKLSHPEKHPRLHLPVPAGATWKVFHRGPNLTDAEVDGDVAFRVRALVAPTVEHTAWIQGVMAEGLPAGAHLDGLALEPGLSARGWPVVLAHAIVRGPDGAPIEERAGAFYALVHNRAEVVVMLRNGVRWQDRAAELRPFMLSGHVEWPEAEHDLVYTLLGFPP